MNVREAMWLIGLGRNSTMKWCAEIGARRTFGQRVLFDKETILRALDEMGKNGNN